MLWAQRAGLKSIRSAVEILRPVPLASSRSSRSYASVADLTQYPVVGEQLHGFTFKRSRYFPDLELSALELRHDRTGAQYLHVARDDTNNVFSIGFKTNPPDATGVPHILEHTTLCGSEKYPVRDPFFKMLPRSLSNFMNAFTSSDHTTYPFATTNVKDFKNLMSVYLDATLHPLLKRSDFTQEGWRIGPENISAGARDGADNAGDQQLVFKGVVYNEMKGQMSDASYLFYIRFQEHMLPALNNSGGDPQRITDLTHEQLTRFHHEHYHPSNAKIFTYGNMPLVDHLQELDRRLQKFRQISVDEDVKCPVDLSSVSQTVSLKGPVDPLVPMDAQHKTSVSWILGDGANAVERFALSLLSALLTDGYGSPVHKALIETGLGSDFTPNTGFDPSSRRPVFSLGLTGVREENVPKVTQAILDVLKDSREKGFDQIKIDGLLHQLELSLKHKTAQFGMGLMQRLNGDWFNGLDPFNSLAWQDTVETFKKELAKGGYLESLMDKYFLGQNTLTFIMEPSKTYGEELAAEEAMRLAEKIAETVKLFPTEKEAFKDLRKRELDLVAEQEAAADADLSCLPSLRVEDIARRRPRKDLRFSLIGDVKVQWREAHTNGLTYFRAIQPLKDLPGDLRGLMPLFSDALMRLGTKNLTTEQLEELIRIKTGGISVGYHVASVPSATNEYEEGFSLSGHAFDKNVAAMYELLNILITETNFDGPEAQAKIHELLQMSANGALDSVAASGHSFARRVAESSLTPAADRREQTSGLAQVRLTAELASRPATESLGDVMAKLKTIQSLVVGSRSDLRVAVTCGSESSASNEAALSRFLASLPWTNGTIANVTAPQSFHSSPAKSFFNLPYQVSYAGVAIPTVPYTNPAGAPLQILAQLLTHKKLHREIREKGGAYGGGAYATPLGGVFGFYSYRDPNPQNTLEVVRRVGEWARDRNWTEQDMQEAKLSVFQGVDAPESVNEEGMAQFLYGIGEDMAQRKREQLLDVTGEDVRRVAQDYLIDRMDRASISVLGERKPWVKEKDGWEFEDLGVARPPAEIFTGENGAQAASGV